jgi:uncharacterized protein DUF4279
MENMTTQFASIRILGPSLDVRQISEVLDLKPSITTGGTHRTTGRKNDAWVYKSQLPETESLNVHLVRLGVIFKEREQLLRGLVKSIDISEVGVFCGITVEGSDACIVLLPETIRPFQEFGAEMGLSTVFVSARESKDDPQIEVTDANSVNDISQVSPENRFTTKAYFRVLCDEPAAAVLAAIDLQENNVCMNPSTHSMSNSWTITAPLRTDEPLNEHLLWLGKKLAPHIKLFRSLIPPDEMSIECEFGTTWGVGSAWISADALSLPINLGAETHIHLKLI